MALKSLKKSQPILFVPDVPLSKGSKLFWHIYFTMNENDAILIFFDASRAIVAGVCPCQNVLPLGLPFFPSMRCVIVRMWQHHFIAAQIESLISQFFGEPAAVVSTVAKEGAVVHPSLNSGSCQPELSVEQIERECGAYHVSAQLMIL